MFLITLYKFIHLKKNYFNVGNKNALFPSRNVNNYICLKHFVKASDQLEISDRNIFI